MSNDIKDSKSVSPAEWITLLIVTQGKTFDDAFNETNEMYIRQQGTSLDRKKIATVVLKELENNRQ